MAVLPLDLDLDWGRAIPTNHASSWSSPIHPMLKLTCENQGYWDRLHRAESWISRAENLKEQEWDDYHGPFIFYWIAFNALHGRHDEIRGKKDINDIKWFLRQICKPDNGRLSEILSDIKRKTDRLLQDRFLSKTYWNEGLSPNFKRSQEKDFQEAQTAYEGEKFDGYLTIYLNAFKCSATRSFMVVQRMEIA